VLKSVQIYNAQSAAYYTQLASTSPGYTHVSKLKTLGNEKQGEHMTIISCKTLSTTVQFVCNINSVDYFSRILVDAHETCLY